MSNSVKQEKRRLIMDIFIVVFILIIVLIVIWILSSGRETVVTSTTETEKQEKIICKTDSDEASFFKSNLETSSEHEIRIVLINNKMSRLYTDYSFTFESNSIAENEAGVLHARHNEMLGKNNIPLDVFSINFSINDNTVKIEMFGEPKNLNSVTSKLFFIDASEFDKVKSMSSASIKTLYESKAFSCVDN